MDKDPTKIVLQTNVKKEKDPTIMRMSGTAIHGDTPFDVPFISHITGNLWQGGVDEDYLHLQLPHFFKHLISVYPFERYKVQRGQLKTEAYFTMYDSVDQTFEQVDDIARLLNTCLKDGPTLIHCQAGLNRSSLIAGRALMYQGYKAEDVINLLREKRSEACLCNPSFEEYLRRF